VKWPIVLHVLVTPTLSSFQILLPFHEANLHIPAATPAASERADEISMGVPKSAAYARIGRARNSHACGL